jgi:hypothetical protein
MTKVSSWGQLGWPTLSRRSSKNLVIFSNKQPRSYDILVVVRVFLNGRVDKFVVVISWVMRRGQMRSWGSVIHDEMSRFTFLLSYMEVGVRISIYGLGYCTHFCAGKLVLRNPSKSTKG